ncbi:unnamed protein product [Linum trigynum]|uniref:Uncharacterized protein n=1 Tax=Linum trigynum TaxID=586398 RepID=A0AAV2FET3_9ROSI
MGGEARKARRRPARKRELGFRQVLTDEIEIEIGDCRMQSRRRRRTPPPTTNLSQRSSPSTKIPLEP